MQHFRIPDPLSLLRLHRKRLPLSSFCGTLLLFQGALLLLLLEFFLSEFLPELVDVDAFRVALAEVLLLPMLELLLQLY